MNENKEGYALIVIVILVSIIGLYVVLSEEEREELHLPGVEFKLLAE